MRNQFRLTGLGEPGKEHPLDRKLFKDLSVTLQERVADTPLTMYILDAKAPDRAKLDIFERVNSGEPLTRQQMRNALYNGVATSWLKEAVNGAEFQKATGMSLNPRTMRDREAVNRYVAFRLLGVSQYRGDMDSFLALGLSFLAELTEEKRRALRQEFNRAMSLCSDLFGDHAFRKSLANGPAATRSVINISLFEVCAAVMSELGPLAQNQQEYLLETITSLIGDPKFSNAITYSTNSTTQVRTRFFIMKEVIDDMPEAEW